MNFRKQVFERSAPAKINLMLAITGTRPDGFHNLVSLVVPIPGLCDDLKMRVCEDATRDSLACNMPGVPLDGSNLVLRAAEAFRARVPEFPFVHFDLEKRIPHGAGLGGGSSDAATAILLMAEAAGSRSPSAEVLREIAAEIGSDCPLFLVGEPLIMRGRGELTEKLTEAEKRAVSEKRFLIFKPAFGVSTAEAYGAMKREAPTYYTPENIAEEKLLAWRKNPTGTPLPLFNDMEQPVFKKHLALPSLFGILRERFGFEAHMSGSGSACFAEISEGEDLSSIVECIRGCWGETAFVAY